MSITEFNTLVLGNAGSLSPFAFTLTRDADSAKDLCQETLCKAFVYREQYQAGTNIKAWLSTIMRNIFINDYRREKRRKLAMEAVGNSQPPYSYPCDGFLHLKEVHQAVHYLPDVFKSAFLLHMQGYKYQEIADALREPLGTIKSRIHFARKLLQKQVDR